MKFKKLISFLFCFNIIFAPCLFQAIAKEPLLISSSKISPLNMKLVPEQENIVPGRTFKVAILLDIQPGHHVYWKHPGEFGLPFNIDWKLPEGFTVVNTEWSNPRVYNEHLTVFGYEKEAMIIATISPSKKIELGQDIPIKVDVNWLACSTDCISGVSSEEIKVPVSLEVGGNNTYFKEAQEISSYNFPKSSAGYVRVSLKEQQEIVFQISNKLSSKFDKILFIPDTGTIELVDFSSSQKVNRTVDETLLTVRSKKDSLLNLNTIKGILLFQNEEGATVSSLLINESLVSDITPLVENSLKSQKATFSTTFLVILVSAFIGGLALNVMPCVLPLITLKVYGLIKTANEKRSMLFKHGFCFAFGVVSCFWLLATIAFCMKFFGHNVGWGFQLQEPIFVSTLTIIFFLFALSSLGVFQLGSIFLNLGSKVPITDTTNKSQRSLLIGSFFNGLLATLITTPCTGPFLGSVLGLVMSFSLLKQFLIFTFMGLGMSLPYLIFSIFPKLVSFLPKPGNWMVVFRQVMGFMMMMTVLWLAWIFASETSVKGLFYLLFSLLVSGFAAWLLGKWGTPIVAKIKRRIISCFAVFLILSALTVGVYASRMTESTTACVTENTSWEAFSSDRLAQLRKEGKSVFVDFTAKWCLTCQANKSVLHDQELEAFFNTHGIVRMVADWTKKDPDISSELAKIGRASVPAYVFYPGGNENPILLPQTLSVKIIAKEIGEFFFDQND